MVRFIDAPSVYIVGQSNCDMAEIKKFLVNNAVAGWETDAPTDAERLIELAGRVCYMSFAKPRPGGNSAYIEHILEVGHGSVLEHANVSVLFEGVSRSLTHQLVRHRAGFSYSELSQRFCDLNNDPAFVVPPLYLPFGWRRSRWEVSVERSFGDYLALSRDACGLSKSTTSRKADLEAARSVLPESVETKIVVTANVRAWRHWIELRGTAETDAEHRRLVLTALPEFQAALPNAFGDYAVLDQNGVNVVRGSHLKV